MKKYNVLFFAFLLAGLLASCDSLHTEQSKTSYVQIETSEAKQEAKNPDIANISIGEDMNVAADMDEMVKNASFIVVSSYQKQTKTINSARDPKNVSNPDPHNYHETRLYSFQVEQVLKGPFTDKTIEVGKLYKKTYKELTDEHGKPVHFQIVNSTFIKPDFGKKYVLFLDKVEFNDTYKGAFANFELLIQPGQTLEMKKPDPKLAVQEFNVGNKITRVHLETVDVHDTVTGKRLHDLIAKINIHK